MTWIDVCSLHLQRIAFAEDVLRRVLRNEVRTGDYRNSMDGG